MNGSKFIAGILGVILMSCYIFPFVLVAFPVANSKMILAVLGLVTLGYNLSLRQNSMIDRGFLIVTIWALIVSLVGFVSITVNNTHEYAYATYVMSMWVWLGGAYFVVSYIKQVHGGVSVRLVANYLIAVCILQCALALLFDFNSGAEEWAKSTFGGERYMGNTKGKRLHGIGCALDVAGLRFAAVLTIIAFFINYTRLHEDKLDYKKNFAFYILSFIVITVIGSLIGRTTIVGCGVGFIYIFFVLLAAKGGGKIIKWLVCLLILVIPIIVFFYNTNPTFHDNLRFGFEGFFNLVENGEWRTNSNEILKNMVIFPDNLHTWLIGDGYFDSPEVPGTETYDPYYIGPHYSGFYKGTDIGYLRFIFYFGLFGLLAFSLFFVSVCATCVKRFPKFFWLFILILLTNFIGWIKVSSDLFMVFAPFLCISAQENEEYENKNLPKATLSRS